VSNSQLLVFYSAQCYIRIYGNATNWNSTGYWEEIYQQKCKFRVKVSTNSVMMSPVQSNDKRSYLVLYKR